MPKNIQPDIYDRKRFFRKIKVVGDCHIWRDKECERRGYGRIQIKGQAILAHRVALYFVNGYWPEQANHKCANKLCVNPKHLYDGNQADNIKDRHTFGLGSGKLIARQVIKIRQAFQQGQTLVKLAEDYSVNFKTIRDIVQNRTWSHLTKETN